MQQLRWLWGALDGVQRFMIQLGAACLFGGMFACAMIAVRVMVL